MFVLYSCFNSLTKHSATSNLIVLSVVCFCDPVDKLGLYNGKSIPRWLLKCHPNNENC